MEKVFDRKVSLTAESALSSTTADPKGAKFKFGTYYEDTNAENGVVCIYLSLPRKAITGYCVKIRALHHANILCPVTYCRAGKGNQHFKILFENKLTWQLKEFVEKMPDKLFDPVVEHGKTVYGMSLILQQIILEIMVTFDDMHSFDLVHGRLSMENTGIYVRSVGDQNEEIYQTKLFGFGIEENFGDTDMMMEKKKDWMMLGTLIKTIFKTAKRPIACCADNLAISLETDPPQPEGIGIYRGHPNFFNFGNKENIIKILDSSRLDAVKHLVRIPIIDAKYSPPSTFEDFIRWLRNAIERNRDNAKLIIAEIEEKNPLIWVQLLELSKKVEPK